MLLSRLSFKSSRLFTFSSPLSIHNHGMIQNRAITYRKPKPRVSKPENTPKTKTPLPPKRLSASSPPESELMNEDEMLDPQVLRQIEEIEAEHYKKHKIIKYHPADEDFIEEGQPNQDEELRELEEEVNFTEPAFDVLAFTEQLKNVSTLEEFDKIGVGFTVENFVEMLEGEQIYDIQVIDVRSKSNELEYLILGTTDSDRHRKATGNYIYLQAKKRYQLAIENGNNFVREFLEKAETTKPQISTDSDEWVCVDCGDVIIHLFSPVTREEYRLDQIWRATPEIDEKDTFRSLLENEELLLTNDSKQTRKKKNSKFADSDSDFD